MSLSNDRLSTFDPSIKKVTVKNGYINLLLHPMTVVVTLSEQELHELTKILQEKK